MSVSIGGRAFLGRAVHRINIASALGLTVLLMGCAWWGGAGHASQPPPGFATSHLAAGQIASTQPVPAQVTESGEARFIVKIKDVPAFVGMARKWQRDEKRARELFAEWAQHEPGLEGLTLEGCSYADELILVHHFEPDEVASRAVLEARLQAIRAHPKVVYADPDFTAHVEEDD